MHTVDTKQSSTKYTDDVFVFCPDTTLSNFTVINISSKSFSVSKPLFLSELNYKQDSGCKPHLAIITGMLPLLQFICTEM